MTEPLVNTPALSGPGTERRDALGVFLTEILDLVEPLAALADNEVSREQFLRGFGWTLENTAFTAWIRTLGTAVHAARNLLADPPDGLAALRRHAAEIRTVVQAVRNTPTSLFGTGQVPADLPELFAADLLAHLVTAHLRGNRPAVYRTAVLLGLLVPAGRAPAGEARVIGGVAVRLPVSRDTLHLNRLPALVRDPEALLRELYLYAGADTAALLFPLVADLAGELGLDSVFGLDAGLDTGLGPDLGVYGEAAAKDMLQLSTRPNPVAGDARFGATLALSPPERGDLGLVVIPSGTADFGLMAGNWAVRLTAEAGDAPFAIGPQGLTLPAGVPALRATLTATRVDEDGSPWTVGVAGGLRLEVGRAEASAHLAVRQRSAPGGPDGIDYGLEAKAGKAALVFTPDPDADGFVRQVFPNGLRVPFDLGIGWSRAKGLHFTGTAGLETTLPVHAALGPVEIRQVHLALHAAAGAGSEPEQVRARVTADLTVDLGIAKATLQGAGLSLGFSAEGGDVDLSPKFAAPTGVGLVIAAGPVTGGGYLSRDEATGEYGGALQLGFGDFQVKALGLIGTRMPDGSDGWSMILLGAGEWSPVQVGMGFSIAGAGAVVGVNRTANVDALRTGLRARALDAVLFPDDPVAKAPTLLPVLGGLFPAARGRHIAGVMARIGWGGATAETLLLRLDLALLLELPAPVRIIALGRILLGLPSVTRPVVRIQLDAAGVVDTGRREASLDAVIYDSAIAGLALSGEMAMRMSWGPNARFALAVGGFHPAFTPPPGFPDLPRLALSLTSGDNPRLRLEGYFAVTSNTVQFGSRADLRAAVGKFAVEGHGQFDALVRFAPFGFTVDMSAAVAVKWGSRLLMALALVLHLRGPRPWHARGQVSFTFLFVKVRVGFEVTLGGGPAPDPVRAVNARDELWSALSSPGAWSAHPPLWGDSLVTLGTAKPKAGEFLVHPLGSVSVRQRVLPLGVRVERIGEAPLTGGPATFSIRSAVFGALVAPITYQVLDQFAPGQFLNLSDHELLGSPSFRDFEAGRSFGTAGPLLPPDAHTAFTTLDYEVALIDHPDEPAREFPRERLGQDLLGAFAAQGPAAHAATRDSGAVYYRAPFRQVTVNPA
ncbi:DUF6603 domain-containing protein [Sinosporangium siamense]|uniref:DUF6603 domain-containing protein n=1 Tax=Sinosporangium siamense TaxID=1367973 RepID=A0A919RRM2_9ACTN|nr:DUF6603 domain-containing protein [Sinosporangium siamense]GII97469.1 hypothetical protein Ssi02_77000 [Sinosporangium siamense]